MPFPARGENVKLGKGSLFLDTYDSDGELTGLQFLGNCNSISLSADVQTAEIFSSTEKSASLLDRRALRTAYSLTASMNEYTLNNLKMFLLATDNDKSQLVGVAVEVEIPDIKVDRYYDLGSRQITGLELFADGHGSTPLVEGTDYEVNTEFGIVHILNGGALEDGDDLTANFDRPALTINQLRIARAANTTAKLLYLADDANEEGSSAKDRLEIWKTSIAPEGELNLISEEYGSFSLTMAVLSDAANHPNDPYGTLDRVAS